MSAKRTASIVQPAPDPTAQETVDIVKERIRRSTRKSVPPSVETAGEQTPDGQPQFPDYKGLSDEEFLTLEGQVLIAIKVDPATGFFDWRQWGIDKVMSAQVVRKAGDRLTDEAMGLLIRKVQGVQQQLMSE